MSKGKKDGLIRAFSVPNGLFESGAHMELFSNNEAVIDGIKGVLEYSDCFIKLNMGKGTVEFYGTGLHISSLDINGLTINGKIEKIEFCV